MSKIARLIIVTVLFSVPLFVQSGLSQPPPPEGGPPCWPPPCVPVDGGITLAIGAAAIFGGKKIYTSFKNSNEEA
jgi:hypothetical protein